MSGKRLLIVLFVDDSTLIPKLALESSQGILHCLDNFATTISAIVLGEKMRALHMVKEKQSGVLLEPVEKDSWTGHDVDGKRT